MSEGTDAVDRQIDAYNAHDLDAFCACYRDDAIIRDGDGRTLMEGVGAMRQQYAALFERFPELSVRIDGRLESGEWVVDREVVTTPDGERSAVAAYRVRGGLIDAVILLG